MLISEILMSSFIPGQNTFASLYIALICILLMIASLFLGPSLMPINPKGNFEPADFFLSSQYQRMNG